MIALQLSLFSSFSFFFWLIQEFFIICTWYRVIFDRFMTIVRLLYGTNPSQNLLLQKNLIWYVKKVVTSLLCQAMFLVLLQDDASLNLSCSICSTPDKNQNRSTCKSNVLNKLFWSKLCQQKLLDLPHPTSGMYIPRRESAENLRSSRNSSWNIIQWNCLQ